MEIIISCVGWVTNFHGLFKFTSYEQGNSLCACEVCSNTESSISFVGVLWDLLFMLLVIQAIGESVKVRQQVIATATVYFKRYYAR